MDCPAAVAHGGDRAAREAGRSGVPGCGFMVGPTNRLGHSSSHYYVQSLPNPCKFLCLVYLATFLLQNFILDTVLRNLPEHNLGPYRPHWHKIPPTTRCATASWSSYRGRRRQGTRSVTVNSIRVVVFTCLNHI